jgi:hypothetical protein
LYFGNPNAYFAAKAGDCTKSSVEILATIITNFVPFLAILFVTFEIWSQIARLKNTGEHGEMCRNLKLRHDMVAQPQATLSTDSSI